MKNKSYLCKTTCLLLSMILLLFNVPIQVSSTEVESQKIDAVSNTDNSVFDQQTENAPISQQKENLTSDFSIVLDSAKKYYIHNLSCGEILRHHSTDYLAIASFGNADRCKWYFEHLGNDRYYIWSAGDSQYALYGSGSDVSLSIMPSNPSDGYIWEIQMISSFEFVIKNKSSQKVLKYDKEADEDFSNSTKPVVLVTLPSSTSAEYEQVLWDILYEDSYIAIESINTSNVEWLKVGSSQGTTLNVTPTNATYGSPEKLSWKSDNPSVATVNGLGVVTGISPGSARITATSKSSNIACTYVVTVGQIIPNGTYYIQNKSTNLFVDIFSGSTDEGMAMVQNEYIDHDQERWIIQYLSSGYYSIKSVYSNKYMSVSDFSYSEEIDYIEQTSTLTNAAKWKITQTASGAYKLIAKSSVASGRVLGVLDNSTASSNVYQFEYTFDASSYGEDNTQYNDEWNFYLVDSMFSDGVGITESEEYFIMNVSNRNYMGLASNSDVNQTNVIASTYANNNMQKWVIEESTTAGEFKFISSNSATGKVLDVTGNNLDIYTDNGQFYQKFVIERINWAPYEGTYIIKYGNNYVSINSSNNVVLSTEFSENAVWSLMRTEKGDADLYNFDYPDYNSTPNSSEFETLFNSLGYTSYVFTNEAAITAYNFITFDDVFIFRGHAGPGCLEFHNSDGSVNGYLYASSDNTNVNCGYLENLFVNDLSSLRCALFLGCSSGRTNSNGNNTLKTVYAKGAHFALGTLDTTISTNSNNFLQYFIQGIDDDCSIGEAIDYAKQRVGTGIKWPAYGYYGYFPITYIGDIYQILH